MIKNTYRTLIVSSLFVSINAIATANNGYTTGANVYSASSSISWYGGGVAYRLAEWRKKDDVSPAVDDSVSPTVSVPETPINQETIQQPQTVETRVVPETNIQLQAVEILSAPVLSIKQETTPQPPTVEILPATTPIAPTPAPLQ